MSHACECTHCWIPERIPTNEDDPDIVFPNNKEVITFGRKIGANDVTLLSQNMSRKDLQFVRWVGCMGPLVFVWVYTAG